MYDPKNDICTESIEIKEDHSEEILNELKSIRRWTTLIGSYILIKIVIWIAIFLLKGSMIFDIVNRIFQITSML